MKICAIFIFLWFACPVLACGDENKKNQKIFARVIQKESSGMEIAIFFPKKINNTDLASVTFNYFKNKEFILLVNAKIENRDFGLSNINLEKYLSSFIAVKPEELKNISISTYYMPTPGQHGVIISSCNTNESYELYEIIENV